MVKKIALEEHFLDPGLVDYWWPTMVDVARPKADELYACLTDFGDRRLETMDKAGIARAVLAISGPGVQVERDVATAVSKARASNDFLAREIQKRPGPLFRPGPSRHAGPEGGRRRARTLRARARSSAAP